MDPVAKLALDAAQQPRETGARLAGPDGHAPSVADPGWLPPASGFPELDALATEHRRLLAFRLEAAEDRNALIRRFKAEDDAVQDAMSEGFREGDSADVPAATPHGERQALLGPANSRVAGAYAAFHKFISEAILTLGEHAPRWLAELDGQRAVAAQQRQEAARLLAEAEALERSLGAITEWTKRNGGVHERAAFRNVLEARFVLWDSMKNYVTPAAPQSDGMGGIKPELVDTYPGAEAHAANLNRGIRPPFVPREAPAEPDGALEFAPHATEAEVA